MKKIIRILQVVIATSILLVSCSKGAPVKSSKLDHPHLTVIAHRGASGYIPEHTIKAYELAKQMKVDYIEIDLDITKDGHLVALHDGTVDRVTNGTGYVKNMTLAQLKKLRIDTSNKYKNLKIPTLEEIVEHFGHSVNYYIETRELDHKLVMEEKLIRILKEHQLVGKGSKRGQVVIESFSAKSLKKIHQLEPEVPLVQLMIFDKEQHFSDKQVKEWKTYANGIGMNADIITKPLITKLQKEGMFIHVFFLKDEMNDMQRMINLKVDGVFTNYPDKAIAKRASK